MLILLALVAFAWLMGLNLYVLLYQQRNVALIAYLRNYYPDIYEKSKNQLSFGMLATDAQTRNALTKAMGDATLSDPNIETVLVELSVLRNRGVRFLVPLTVLFFIILILYLRA